MASIRTIYNGVRITLNASGLLAHRETNQIRANTEAGTLASRNPDAGAHDVEDGEDRRRDNAERQDLHRRQRALRHKDGRNRDKETLYEVLDQTIHNFSGGVHFLYF